MRVRLVVAPNGYSFTNQARSLEQGLLSLGVDAGIGSGFPHPEVVVGVGSWRDYEVLVTEPLREKTVKVVPWIVSDDKVDGWVSELNQLPMILTTSRHCQSIMVRDGINPDRIKILPEAVDSEFWQPLSPEELKPINDLLSIADKDSPFKYNLGLLKKSGVPILFTTGGDATSKGAQEVIQALGSIYESSGNKQWLYLIKTWPAAGSLRRSAEELDLAASLGIWENIRYVVGEFSQDFMRGLMNLCDIYAAPSRGEGFGLPLVEAAMCSKPVLTCQGTAASETVIHGSTGWIAQSITDNGGSKADVKDLAGYLQKLLTDSQMRKNMGELGRQKAIARYSPQVVAKEFLNLLK